MGARAGLASVLFVLLLLASAPTTVTAQRSLLAEVERDEAPGAGHLVEWFPASACADCAAIEALAPIVDQPGDDVAWITWPAFSEPGDDTDARQDPEGIRGSLVRAGQRGVTTLPALLVDGVPVALDGGPDAVHRRLAQRLIVPQQPAIVELPIALRIVTEGDGSQPDAIEIDATIRPQANISDASRLVITVTEASTTDERGQARHHLARAFRSSISFNIGANTSTSWSDNLSVSDDLGVGSSDPTRGSLARYTLVAFVIDDDNETVLAQQQITLPAVGATASGGRIGLWVGLGLAVLAGLVGIILAERGREVGMPRLGGQAEAAGDDWLATVMIEAGRSGVDLRSITADAPHRLKRKAKSLRIVPGGSNQLQVRLAGPPGDAILRCTVEIDTLGEWVLDLRLPLHRHDED